MRIAVVTGNPKPASRTHGVALAVAHTLSAALIPSARSAPLVPSGAVPPLPASPGAPAPLVIDLAEHASALFDSSDAELTRLTAEVAKWAEAAVPLIRRALAPRP
jgi:hypothetical protein